MNRINSSRARLIQSLPVSAAIGVSVMVALAACGAEAPRPPSAEPVPAMTSPAAGVLMIPRVGDAAPIVPVVQGAGDKVPVVPTTTQVPPPVPLASIPDVGFELDASSLTPTATEILTGTLEHIRNVPGIEIDGHTDSKGTADHNQALSEDRARAVAAWLIYQGVPPERITTSGFGSTRPIASNDDASGRAANRRVEILAKR